MHEQIDYAMDVLFFFHLNQITKLTRSMHNKDHHLKLVDLT